jgi:hypothetical protein
MYINRVIHILNFVKIFKKLFFSPFFHLDKLIYPYKNEWLMA